MIYEIESKVDVSGAMLVVRFPETDLDVKALYTIQADPPPFLVPFRYRSIDGQVECTYTLGDLSKLQYRFGTRKPEEYIDFWSKILQPLLDCGDWFLKPLSFVLDPLQLYTDREGKNVYYLYIPSMRDCVSFEEMRGMVSELSQKNAVTDTGLENRVLRAIMQDFQPKAFLQMLRAYQPKPAAVHAPTPTPPVQAPASPAPIMPEMPEQRPAASAPRPAPIRSAEDDIVIDLSGGAQESGRAEKKHLFGRKEEKKKAEKPTKKGGLFGGKKDKKSKEILLGAAAEGLQQAAPPQRASVSAAPIWTPPAKESEVTQLDEGISDVCLRLVGDPSLPREIPVSLMPGAAFTIGRFDVSVGHQQSDFEFDKKTKAVSRHHAVIERRSDGSYTIMDLSSAAGTFVDGMRITPNVPQRLERGSRIAFGTGGADYVWEE